MQRRCVLFMYNSTYRRRFSLLCLFARNRALLGVLGTVLSVTFSPERVYSCLRTNETMLAQLKACQDDVLLQPSLVSVSQARTNFALQGHGASRRNTRSSLSPRLQLQPECSALLFGPGIVYHTLTFLSRESFIIALILGYPVWHCILRDHSSSHMPFISFPLEEHLPEH